MTLSQPAEALLCAYYRAEECGHTIEELCAMYPRVKQYQIVTVGVELEKAGYIEPMPQGGYRITCADTNHYLESCED